MTLELLSEPSAYFPITLERGQGFRFQVELTKGRMRAAINLSTADMKCEIRAEDDPESTLLSVAELDVIDDESGIYQHFWTDDTILGFDAAARFGWVFVFVSCAETDFEWKIIGRGPVRVR